MTTDQPAVGEQPSKLAGGCVLTIGAVIAGAVVYAVPETGYYAAGLLTTAGIRKAITWHARRHGGGEQPEAEDTVDIVGLLHELSPQGASNVRLTQLAEAASLPDTKPVRALLTAADIPVKEVRTGSKVGQGVHASSIPRSCDAPPDSCWCAVTSNNNTNNTDSPADEKGLRVDHIGHGGVVVTDPTETRRHHATTR